MAKCVKLADLEHNSDLSRIDHPTAKDIARIQKYHEAIALLEDKNKDYKLGDCQDLLSDEWIKLGSSCADYNAVTLVGRNNGRIVPQMLWFDLPGDYYATVIHNGAPIPEGYVEVTRYEGFVDAVTVMGHGALLEGKEIVFYRRGEMECIVTVKQEEGRIS